MLTRDCRARGSSIGMLHVNLKERRGVSILILRLMALSVHYEEHGFGSQLYMDGTECAVPRGGLDPIFTIDGTECVLWSMVLNPNFTLIVLSVHYGEGVLILFSRLMVLSMHYCLDHPR